MSNIFVPENTWTMADEGYGRHPEVCVDNSGRIWVVWISWNNDGEVVLACHGEPGEVFCKPFPVCIARPQVMSLAIAPWRGGIIVSWIDGGDVELDGLKIRLVQDSRQLGAERLILPARRSPMGLSMAADDQSFILAWTVREPRGRQVEGILGIDPENPPQPIRFSERRLLNLRPAVTIAHGCPWVCWQSMSGSGSRILARRFGKSFEAGAAIELSRTDGGIDAMCSVAGADGGGVWVAWHSDRDPLRGPGLVRWIEVVLVDESGQVNRPDIEMTDVDRSGRGEDQGFEFPSLSVGADGRLIIIGRGSQSLRRQDLTPTGWTARGQVDSPGWQCRGRFKSCMSAEGVLVIGREKNGIVLRRLPLSEIRESDVPPPRKDFSWKTDPGFTILGRRVLFGDIHQHTVNSDGTGTDAETYLRARYRYGDDLVAISDHESFLGKKTPPGEWARIRAVADDFYEPGAFVTLHAFEWTGSMYPGPGHKVVYPAPGAEVMLSRDNPRTASSAGLMAACREHGALAFPHHVGWTGADMENHDPDVQTCFEIVSCHGAYERIGGTPITTRGDDKAGQFVADALDAGLRFGFVGGSDGHGLNWHHGVCRMEDSHRTGLTAVITDSVTREGVLDALARRSCYATSGAKIALWFEVDGMPMGEEVRPGGISSYRVVVRGTANIESLCLVSNSGRETALRFSGRRADVHGTLPPPSGGGWAYYFVRVVQSDGHMAWSSPIWIESSLDPQNGRLTA